MKRIVLEVMAVALISLALGGSVIWASQDSGH